MNYRILIAAGGTGGHVFPALALGEEIRERWNDAEILFVGTKRGLEERVIPAAGFRLKTITMRGLVRSWAFLDVMGNLLLPLILFFGMMESLWVLLSFKPRAVIGCGGYVTGPVVLMGKLLGKKTLIQEQNSRPGRTSLLLQSWADEIHVTYEDAKCFFKATDKIIVSGNPLRKGLSRLEKSKACEIFGLNPDKKVLLVIGGSLGARAMNQALVEFAGELNELEILWQTGKNSFEEIESKMRSIGHVKVMPFIENMAAAYSSADLVFCRAGAMTLSEITRMGLPSILAPYPYAADNHQEYNAQSLVNRGAGIMIKDSDLHLKLKSTLIQLINNKNQLAEMAAQSVKLSKPYAARDIVNGLEKLLTA